MAAAASGDGLLVMADGVLPDARGMHCHPTARHRAVPATVSVLVCHD